MRMRVLPSLTALLLGAATALLFACGGNGRIPTGDASKVEQALDKVEAQFRAGNCTGAEQGVAQARAAIAELPDSVDSRLRSRLSSGLHSLSTRVPATCGQSQQQEQTQTQPTDTTPTVATDTPTTSTEPTDTTPTTPTDTGESPPPTDTNPTDTNGLTTPGDTTGGTPSGGE